MLKKASRKNAEVRDVAADDPVGTMERFTDGLRRVLAVHKHSRMVRRSRRKRKN